MSEWVPIRLNNFLFNAGVVGFVYMLDNNKDKIPSSLYKIAGSTLSIDSQIFTDEQYDLSSIYFESLQSRFKTDTAWNRLVNLEGEIARRDLTLEEDQKKFDIAINDGLLGKAKKLESASYKSGYAIIQQSGDHYDALAEWQAIKKEKNREVQRKKLLEILRYVKKYPKVFCYKDIAYSKIQYIWGGVAFLYAQNSKKDMLQCYRDTFLIPLNHYLTNQKKGNDQCIECGKTIKKDEAMGLSWLQMGVDHKRKKSYFGILSLIRFCVRYVRLYTLAHR